MPMAIHLDLSQHLQPVPICLQYDQMVNSCIHPLLPELMGVRQGATSQAMILDPKSRQAKKISVEKSNSMNPTFSPDGKWLVYAAESQGKTGLRVQEVTNGKERWLAFPFQRNELEARGIQGCSSKFLH